MDADYTKRIPTLCIHHLADSNADKPVFPLKLKLDFHFIGLRIAKTSGPK